MSENNSEYFIGKVIQIKRGKNPLVQVQDTSSKRKVDCQINAFCPLEVGDSIAVDDYMLIEGNIYLFTKQPIVLIGKDDETIKNFIFRAFAKNKAEGFKIFHSLQNDAKQFRKNYLEYINDICCRWATSTPVVRDRIMRNKFNDFDHKLVKNFLKLWYKRRILRQFYVFGFTLTEIKTIQEFHSSEKNLAQLFQDFIQNPYVFFTIKQDKIDDIATKLQKDDSEHIYIYSVLRDLYLQFCSGRNGFPIDEFCEKYPDTLVKIDPWIVKYKGMIYFKSIFEKEKEIAEKLQEISTVDVSFTSSDISEHLTDLSLDQQEAVKGLLTSSLGIVSGPAGSGKTTILKKVVSMIEANGEKVVIASFTGKAVARLRQVLQRDDPQTLHFLLKKPVEFDVLIIDEASMVSSSLLHQVLTSFEDSFKLYLIGDVSQLPPIEWGRPFYDLIQTKKIPTYFLTKCHRFYENSGEVNGILENANGMIGNSGWKWSERKNFKILRNSSVLKVIETAIENNISMFDFTVLCPFNKPLHDINQRASKLFLPKASEVVDLNGRTWRIGDRVINLKNRYDLNIMNGDDGVVMDFVKEPNSQTENKIGLKVRFGELLVEFLFGSENAVVEEGKETNEDVDEDLVDVDPDEKGPPTTRYLVQSYAMTVHKSQGSEWDYVLLYLPYDPRGFVTKNLFYTAITRARKCLWIIAENQTTLSRIIQLQSEFGRDALTMLY
jgi:AraC-like DNA-binding protein